MHGKSSATDAVQSVLLDSRKKAIDLFDMVDLENDVVRHSLALDFTRTVFTPNVYQGLPKTTETDAAPRAASSSTCDDDQQHTWMHTRHWMMYI